jgi:hypothetical protein
MIKKIIVCLLVGSIYCAQALAAAVIDYKNVGEFSSLSGSRVLEAAGVRIMLRHASVGQCISSGLDALMETDGLYDRGNFVFQARGNPGWPAKIGDFVDQVNLQASDFDAFNMKFCYIDSAASASAYIKAMERLQAGQPGKLFIWWTMPLTVARDTRAQSFNRTVRTYAKAHNKVLFDIASIESHHEDGSPCVKQAIECLCPEYTEDGGHPNHAASLRIAKAYWVLADRLAGQVRSK